MLGLGTGGCNQGGANAGTGTDGSRTESPGKQSLKNLKQIALGLSMWLGDNNETYPSISKAADAKTMLLHYINNEAAFVSPDTSDPYLFNLSISGRTLSSITDPAGTVTFYEGSSTDGMRSVAFADGHVERVSEDQWQKLKQTSGIP